MHTKLHDDILLKCLTISWSQFEMRKWPFYKWKQINDSVVNQINWIIDLKCSNAQQTEGSSWCKIHCARIKSAWFSCLMWFLMLLTFAFVTFTYSGIAKKEKFFCLKTSYVYIKVNSDPQTKNTKPFSIINTIKCDFLIQKC